MSATAKLNSMDSVLSYSEGYDDIIITDYFQGKRGGVTLDYTGYPLDGIRAGHIIIKQTDVEDSHRPMPIVAGNVSGVATFGAVVGGTGYTNGTYTNVPLGGGSGLGATGTVTVAATVVSAVTVTSKGNGYTAGDILTVPGALSGGTGSGATVAVATVASVATTYAALPGGFEYYGFAVNSSKKGGVADGIAVRGNVNPKIGLNADASALGYFNFTSLIPAIKTALPTFTFLGDND